MRFGLALPHYDFSFPDGRSATVDAVVEHAVAAERSGFGSVWISDHLFLDLERYGGPATRYGTVEALTTLAALARETSTVRLGTLVLGAAFRQPLMLANEAATIEAASGGRFDLGLGAGWYDAEYAALGIPFGTAGERIALLEDVLRILHEHTTGTPVWIGSKGGPRMLRLVAEHADGWNVVWRIEPRAYRERLDVLARACERAGRDPASVRRSVGLLCVVGEDERDLAARWRRAQAWTPGRFLDGTGPEAYGDALVGTPQTVAARIREFAELGVEEIILSFAPLPFAVADAELPALFMESVAPLVG